MRPLADIDLCDDPQVVPMKYVYSFFVDLAVDAKDGGME